MSSLCGYFAACGSSASAPTSPAQIPTAIDSVSVSFEDLGKEVAPVLTESSISSNIASKSVSKATYADTCDGTDTLASCTFYTLLVGTEGVKASEDPKIIGLLDKEKNIYYNLGKVDEEIARATETFTYNGTTYDGGYYFNDSACNMPTDAELNGELMSDGTTRAPVDKVEVMATSDTVYCYMLGSVENNLGSINTYNPNIVAPFYETSSVAYGAAANAVSSNGVDASGMAWRQEISSEDNTTITNTYVLNAYYNRSSDHPERNSLIADYDDVTKEVSLDTVHISDYTVEGYTGSNCGKFLRRININGNTSKNSFSLKYTNFTKDCERLINGLNYIKILGYGVSQGDGARFLFKRERDPGNQNYEYGYYCYDAGTMTMVGSSESAIGWNDDSLKIPDECSSYSDEIGDMTFFGESDLPSELFSTLLDIQLN